MGVLPPSPLPLQTRCPGALLPQESGQSRWLPGREHVLYWASISAVGSIRGYRPVAKHAGRVESLRIAPFWRDREGLTRSCWGAWRGRAAPGAGSGPRGVAGAAWAAAEEWAVTAWWRCVKGSKHPARKSRDRTAPWECPNAGLWEQRGAVTPGLARSLPPPLGRWPKRRRERGY